MKKEIYQEMVQVWVVRERKQGWNQAEMDDLSWGDEARGQDEKTGDSQQDIFLWQRLLLLFFIRDMT